MFALTANHHVVGIAEQSNCLPTMPLKRVFLFVTYKGWQSGRRSMPSVAIRCVELLLQRLGTAGKLSKP